jgi:UDP-N-acetylglucosamine--N-acetylmuramyl-(pentapeptide) pyrophosphoryl-undecaprenol N-acetylglucosamine transferase
VVITGNLLRYQLFKQNKLSNPKIKFKDSSLPLLYITAGNQGSHSINLLIKKIISKLTNFNIIHQTGKDDYPKFKFLNKKYPNYFSSNYFDTLDYGWIIQQATLFISRAGANTCQEIVTFGKNSILIPLPKSQQNEQQLNALWVKKEQPQQTIIIPQEKLSPKTLLDSIKSFNSLKNTSNPKKFIPNLKLLQLINEII